MSIHPQVIEKEGKKEFVVLPYEEFLAIKESLEDFEDLNGNFTARRRRQNDRFQLHPPARAAVA